MELGIALCPAAAVSLAPVHPLAPSPAHLEFVPWAIPAWACTGAGCSGSEDSPANLQTLFIHGQFMPIVRVPML